MRPNFLICVLTVQTINFPDTGCLFPLSLQNSTNLHEQWCNKSSEGKASCGVSYRRNAHLSSCVLQIIVFTPVSPGREIIPPDHRLYFTLTHKSRNSARGRCRAAGALGTVRHVSHSTARYPGSNTWCTLRASGVRSFLLRFAEALEVKFHLTVTVIDLYTDRVISITGVSLWGRPSHSIVMQCQQEMVVVQATYVHVHVHVAIQCEWCRRVQDVHWKSHPHFHFHRHVAELCRHVEWRPRAVFYGAEDS
ncbi:hypothetical protein J6590_003437 [Homalodisca vitripennis]|nr:hypothetical protein J6590_003437 [Homalodisca vitripennis]